MLGQRGSFVGQVGLQQALDVVPDRAGVFEHGGVGDRTLLDAIECGHQRLVGAQPLDELGQPAVVALAHRVVGLRQHLAQLAQHRGAELVGQAVGHARHRRHQFDHAHHLGPFLARVAHHQFGHPRLDLVLGQEAGDLLQAGIQQFVVTAAARQQREHVGRGGGAVPAARLGDDQVQRGAPHALVVEQADRLERPAPALADPVAHAGRVGQPVAQAARRIELGQAQHERGRLEEVVAHEMRQAVGDALLAARQDGRVRQRQAQRAPEQRDHGEPVGDRAHGRGFAERLQPAPAALPALPGGQRQAGQRGRQQAGGDPFHALEGGDAGVRDAAHRDFQAIHRGQCALQGLSSGHTSGFPPNDAPRA